MRVRALAAVAVTATLLPVMVVASASATEVGEDDNLVTVVHGIPLVPEVDVYVNGDLTLDDFEYLDFDGLAVPDGEYVVAVTDSDDADDSAPILEETFSVDGDVTIAAQLDDAGAPGLVAYADDYSPTAAGAATIVARHAANFPAVAVTANGTEVISDLNNSESATLSVPADTYELAVTIAGVVVPESVVELELEAGLLYTFYAVGDGEFGFESILIIDEVGEADAAPTTAPSSSATTSQPAIPTAVPAGDGTSGWTGPLGVPALIAISLAAVAALGAGVALRRTSVTGTRH